MADVIKIDRLVLEQLLREDDSRFARPQQKGNLLRTIRLCRPSGEISQVTFAPDGRHLITTNGNRTVYVLRLAGPDGKQPPKKNDAKAQPEK